MRKPPDRTTRVVELLVMLAGAVRAELDEAALGGYALALDDLPLDRIEAAVRRAVRECRFMPSAAELRVMAGEMPADQRAQIAWDAACNAVRRHGYTRSVAFDDPVIHATIKHLGGWCWFCEASSSDEFPVHVRRNFEEAYRRYFASGITAEMAEPLVGELDAQNKFHGYFDAVKPPYQVATGLPRAERTLLGTPKQVELVGQRPLLQQAPTE